MQLYILIFSLVFVLLVGTLIIVAIAAQRSRTVLAPEEQGKQPKGYWMSLGISIGAGIGVALGTALENLGAGIAIGIAIGAGIGASLEQKNKDNVRPLTEAEKQAQKWGVGIGLIALVLVALILAAIFFTRMR